MLAQYMLIIWCSISAKLMVDRFDDYNGYPARVAATRMGAPIISKIDHEGGFSNDNLYGTDFYLIQYISQGLNFEMK